MKIKKTEYQHTKEAVKWDKKPDLSAKTDGSYIVWAGKCSCGLRVYETYSQEEGLYDEETGNEV